MAGNIVAEIADQFDRVKHRSFSIGSRERVDLWLAPDGKITILPTYPLALKVGPCSPVGMERCEQALIEAGFTKVTLTKEQGRDPAIEICGAAARQVKATLETNGNSVTLAEAVLPERAWAKLINALETLKRDYAAGRIDPEYAQFVYTKVAQLTGNVSRSDALRIQNDVSQVVEGKLDAGTAAQRTLKAQLGFYQGQQWIRTAGVRLAPGY